MKQSQYGPRVSYLAMKAGTSIFYTGDMANAEGKGVIVKQFECPRFKYKLVDINMDDGRTFNRVGVESFQPAPGRRFWLLDDWFEDRKAKIAEQTKRIRAGRLCHG